MPTMEIRTTRFGAVAIEPDDVISFPSGLWGLEDCVRWVLLADAEHDALGWLQSVTRPEIALAVVSPRRFVPDYQVRIARGELGPLGTDSQQETYVLVIVNKNEESITLNLKAPLVINLHERQGRQVVAGGDQPLQYALCREPAPRKKIA
jgi:flagellar assembly factor FliW